MQQLQALDAAFLSMETDATPAHIGGATILDPSTCPEPFDFERFRRFVDARVRRVARFGWKLQHVPFGLDLPYWVEDEQFEPANHVIRTALPQPAGFEELSELIGFLYARPLDPDRPLWEIFVIEGLQGGRIAMLWKLHHCLMDGESGAGLADLLFDLQPEPAADPLVDPGHCEPAGAAAHGAADWLQVGARAVRNAARRPLAATRHVARFASAALDAQRNPTEAGSVPRVSFNGEVGPRRAVAWASVSLEEVKALKNRFGVTVNDVVLALTSGALRRYLAERNELPECTLSAMVPVSTRAADDASVGNQITQMALPWATDLKDPVERLMTIHASALQAKQTASRSGANLIQALGESLPPAAMRAMVAATALSTDYTPLPANAVVSNVRFADVPIFVAGARLERLLPISVLAPCQGLNITVVSYFGELHFGLTVDPNLVPHPSWIADGIPKALTELWEAAGQHEDAEFTATR